MTAAADPFLFLRKGFEEADLLKVEPGATRSR